MSDTPRNAAPQVEGTASAQAYQSATPAVAAFRKAHDHRQSIWIIAGGTLLWCYRCGAWRPNVAGKMRWHKPTGPNGKNPACEN